jgi:hypothetical protein
MGTEVGDLCVALTVKEQAFTAQRIWSNAAAAAGRSPCAPAPQGDVFFSAMPVSTTPLTIAAGGQATLSVTGWATSPRPPWSVVAVDYPGGGFDGTVAPTGVLDRVSMGSGDSAKLVVSVPGGAASGSRGILVIDSLTATAGGAITAGPYAWPILVQVP